MGTIMHTLHNPIIAALLLVVLTGCNKAPEAPAGPPMYTATAHLEVLPLITNSLAGQREAGMALPERIALEVKLARQYDLAAEMIRQSTGDLERSDWYRANEGRDLNHALADVMRIAPTRGKPGQLAVSVTLDDPEDAAMLATAAAQAIEACSAEPILQQYAAEIEALSTSCHDLDETIAQRTRRIEEVRALLGADDDNGEAYTLADLQAEEVAALFTIAEAEELIGKINRHAGEQLVALPAVRTVLRERGDYESDEERLKTLRIEYRDMLRELGREHAEVEAAADEITAMNARLVGIRTEVVEGLRADAAQTIADGQERLAAIRRQLAAWTDAQDGETDIHETLADLERGVGFLRHKRQAMAEEIDTLTALAEVDRRLEFVQPAAVPTESN